MLVCGSVALVLRQRVERLGDDLAAGLCPVALAGEQAGQAPHLDLPVETVHGPKLLLDEHAGNLALVVGLDGVEDTPGDLVVDPLRPQLVLEGSAGQPTTVHYFRGDELQETRLVPTAPPADTWTLTLATAEGEVLARRQAWLGL